MTQKTKNKCVHVRGTNDNQTEKGQNGRSGKNQKQSRSKMPTGCENVEDQKIQKKPG